MKRPTCLANLSILFVVASVLLLCSLAVSSTGYAQNYIVERFTLVQDDLTAKIYPKDDNNGRKCALIKVYADDKIPAVRGNIIGDITSVGMEKSFYISEGTKKIEIVFDNHYPLRIVFGDYNIPSLMGGMTYVLELKSNGNSFQSTVSEQRDNPSAQSNAQSTIQTPTLSSPSSSSLSNTKENSNSSSVNQTLSSQFTPLPLKPGVKSGVLPNGLIYYILHNEQPKDRANFYIAQKVGSTLETQEQLGLSHFLEHMAFNGITHYPGNNLINYLKSKGLRFGADINAYTAFDETVYNIDNVITTDKPLMDSVLLVIRDWCDGILLEESEIEAERGVINEEWRQRNDVGSRMYTTILPQIFKEYQYQQMPIGKMEVVMNFKPEVLRNYYKTWYRPDQQGIVIVGDFDADEMEKKVRELFSTVKMPENASPREYVAVSDNDKPIYAHFEDPELKSTTVMTFFKCDKMPWEMRNTGEGFLSNSLVQTVLVRMIQDRLDEYSTNPECPYAAAQVFFSDFLVAPTKEAFSIYVVPSGDILPAYNAAMQIIARACKTGFTQSELERANSGLINGYEKSFNEKDKTYNSAYGRELINHFIKNEPMPGIETELQLAQQMLPMIPVEAYNQIAQQILTAENQVVVVSQPLNDNTNVLEEMEVISALEACLSAEY